MPYRYEVRLSGSGGQGLILAGIILAEAAGIYDGKYVCQSQSYGPEARGGASKSEVIISDEEIDYPKAIKPDVLLAMNQSSCDLYFFDLKPNGLLIVDSTFVKQTPTTKVVALPFTSVARKELGKEMVANVVALGSLVFLSGAVSLKSLEAALDGRAQPPGDEPWCPPREDYTTGRNVVTPMRILVTNDDGIYAKGIEVLFLALAADHEVLVVAPETEQSAVGHAITFLDPLRVREVKRNGAFFGYAVNGTPADCVKLAIRELMRPLPDMVISGINMGANVGENVIYSGTVSAATEAAMLGFPSIALSINAYPATDYSGPLRYVPDLLRRLEYRRLPKGVSLNVNFPHCSAEEIRGFKITRQGHLKYAETYDRRIDPRNRVYYWLCSQTAEHDPGEDTDSYAISERYIAITPIHYDLKHYPTLALLAEWMNEV